jgi:hypothetical protein
MSGKTVTQEHTSIVTSVFAQIINTSESSDRMEFKDGIPHTNLRVIADFFDIRIDAAKRIVNKNEKVFEGLYFEKETDPEFSTNLWKNQNEDEIAKRGRGAPEINFYLQDAGVIIFLSFLNPNLYDGEQEELIKLFRIGTANLATQNRQNTDLQLIDQKFEIVTEKLSKIEEMVDEFMDVYNGNMDILDFEIKKIKKLIETPKNKIVTRRRYHEWGDEYEERCK